MRWSVTVFSVLLLAIFGSILWIESPFGSQATSQWATRLIQRRFPDTEIRWEKIQWIGPLQLKVHNVTWEKGEGVTLLKMGFLLVSGRWTSQGLSLRLEGSVQQLPLSPLDRLLTEGRWQAQGNLTGTLGFTWGRSRFEEMDFTLDTVSPGGSVSNEWIGHLVSFLPQEDARGRLLASLEGKGAFHFRIGKLQARTQGEDIQFRLLLDGDHLLDITIRIPKESLEILGQWIKVR